jgi:hypothetical protein
VVVALEDGVVNAKFWALMPIDVVAVKPRAFAVMVSVPDLLAVTVNDACPVDAVVTVAGVNVFPSADVRVTTAFAIPVLAEFASDTV